jgi:DNA-binding NtrC family response regulator
LNQTIILFDTSSQQRWSRLTATLEANGFQVLRCRSISDVAKVGPQKHCWVVILDLDNPVVNNRVLRELKRNYSGLQIIGISGRPFHPELTEAMRSYIYACISKPVDPDELIYWLKSIFCDP